MKKKKVDQYIMRAELNDDEILAIQKAAISDPKWDLEYIMQLPEPVRSVAFEAYDHARRKFGEPVVFSKLKNDE